MLAVQYDFFLTEEESETEALEKEYNWISNF